MKNFDGIMADAVVAEEADLENLTVLEDHDGSIRIEGFRERYRISCCAGLRESVGDWQSSTRPRDGRGAD